MEITKNYSYICLTKISWKQRFSRFSIEITWVDFAENILGELSENFLLFLPHSHQKAFRQINSLYSNFFINVNFTEIFQKLR